MSKMTDKEKRKQVFMEKAGFNYNDNIIDDVRGKRILEAIFDEMDDIKEMLKKLKQESGDD